MLQEPCLYLKFWLSHHATPSAIVSSNREHGCQSQATDSTTFGRKDFPVAVDSFGCILDGIDSVRDVNDAGVVAVAGGAGYSHNSRAVDHTYERGREHKHGDVGHAEEADVRAWEAAGIAYPHGAYGHKGRPCAGDVSWLPRRHLHPRPP